MLSLYLSLDQLIVHVGFELISCKLLAKQIKLILFFEELRLEIFLHMCSQLVSVMKLEQKTLPMREFLIFLLLHIKLKIGPGLIFVSI